MRSHTPDFLLYGIHSQTASLISLPLRCIASKAFAAEVDIWPAQDIFFWVRSKFIVLVKSKMFGITPDRHTWMLELSYEPFVNGSRCMPNIVPLLDLSGTISDLIPKKDVLCRPLRDQGEGYLVNTPQK